MTKPKARRKPCQNCGELVAVSDEHYYDNDRDACGWLCPSTAEVEKRIRDLRAHAERDQRAADELAKRRGMKHLRISS